MTVVIGAVHMSIAYSTTLMAGAYNFIADALTHTLIKNKIFFRDIYFQALRI
ncbi:MAG: hypothetical protein UZ10_BCD003002191 [Bacteroidetes bacterium OLB10]|nr:MAG: hypothetical protein UZ10_BCD003002191 [Bacteroidetes bacterium OLB10]